MEALNASRRFIRSTDTSVMCNATLTNVRDGLSVRESLALGNLHSLDRSGQVRSVDFGGKSYEPNN